MLSLICLQFSMQKLDIIEHTSAKCHVFTLRFNVVSFILGDFTTLPQTLIFYAFFF